MSKSKPMRIKSYFTKTVDQAMVQAREELGTEAVLLNTRKAAPTEISGGGYEVIFGVAEEAPARTEKPSPLPTAHETRAPQQLSAEIERLHRQMDEIRSLIVRSSRAQLTIGRTVPELADVYSHLMSSDVEPALSKDIVDRLEASMATDAFFERGGTGTAGTANRWKAMRCDWRRLESFLRVELETRVGLAPRFGSEQGPENGHPAVVLVGPRGAGKTTSLAKLAVARARFGNEEPARLFSLDMSATAAHTHLQSIAGKNHIAVQEVPAAYLLPGLIAEARRDEIVFVDTPGYATADASAAAAAASAFAECPKLDVHLVVPGYMKASDLRLCIQKYAAFRPTKLLVTKLDETHAFGSIFSEAARAGLKLSFIGHGPSIPHDIRAASHEDLMNMAIERPKARAQCVA